MDKHDSIPTTRHPTPRHIHGLTPPRPPSLPLTRAPLQVHQVLASDKVSSINRPLVRLQLHLNSKTSNDQDQQANAKEVSLELSSEELDALIAQLEVAKGALDKVKAAAV
jgi:hypothetical protein